jgi:hypothetical protein
MIYHGYTYIFICQMLTKYETLIQEAPTREAREFCIEQWQMYYSKYKNYFN